MSEWPDPCSVSRRNSGSSSAGPTVAIMKATAIIPVKRLDAAKQRLSDSLTPTQRRQLMTAMFADTLEAVSQTRMIERLIVVTADREISRQAVAAGAEVIADPPDAGHSAAALLGITAAGSAPVILLPGDCPLLDPRQVDGLLTGLPTPFVIVVPDRHGSGTNSLVLSPAGAIEPSFGEGSRARHVEAARSAGIPHAIEEVETLGLDMDTPADLIALATAFKARRAGRRGRRTAKVLGL